MGVRYSNGIVNWLGGPFKYPTFWTLSRPVFKWYGHMTLRTIQIIDISDLKQTFYSSVFRLPFEYWTIWQPYTNLPFEYSDPHCMCFNIKLLLSGSKSAVEIVESNLFTGFCGPATWGCFKVAGSAGTISRPGFLRTGRNCYGNGFCISWVNCQTGWFILRDH